MNVGDVCPYMGDVLMYVAFFVLGHFTVTHWKPPNVFTHSRSAVQLCERFSHSSTSRSEMSEVRQACIKTSAPWPDAHSVCPACVRCDLTAKVRDSQSQFLESFSPTIWIRLTHQNQTSILSPGTPAELNN